MMSTATTAISVTLTAEHDNGARTVHKLDAEQSVLIGTSSNCGLRLEGETLSTFHCLISLEEGTLWVQDWASKEGTFVNGEAIRLKTVLAPGDQLRVGPFRIAAEFDAGRSAPSRSGPDRTLVRKPVTSEPPDPVQAIVETEPADLPVPRQDGPPLQDDPPLHEPPTAVPSRGGAALVNDWFDGETFEQETNQLLQAEIEDLQGILAQRDVQIAELMAQQNGGGTGGPASDGEASETLLARLEELLEEAACSDERMAVLEDMLRAAEEAQQAEQEERNQLEAWVNDIERRIGQRDEQRNAELEAVRLRLGECESERDRAHRMLQQAAAEGSAPKCYEETLERLQQHNKELQEQLTATMGERSVLAERLESGESQHDQALREERVAIAQERALVSRMRSELTNKLAALEEMPEPAEQPDREVANRLRTLREHLREIHLQEQQQQLQQPGTLTSRITRLWKRVDDRSVRRVDDA